MSGRRFAVAVWACLGLAWAAPVAAAPFYVSNTTDVYHVSAAGVVTPFASGFSVAQAMAVDAAGTLYVAGSGDNTIKKVSPAGTVTTFATGLNGPTGLAFGAGGDLFVANIHDQTIRRVSPAGVVTPFATAPAGSGPVGLAFDADGNLYAANVFAKTISRITPAGAVTTLATVGGTKPQWLTFNPADNALYLSDADTDQVKRVTLAGGVSTFATGFSSPEGMVFNTTGELLVTNFHTNDVVRVSANGATRTPLAAGIPNPVFITHVPEPTGCGLLILCAAAACTARRPIRAGGVRPSGRI